MSASEAAKELVSPILNNDDKSDNLIDMDESTTTTPGSIEKQHDVSSNTNHLSSLSEPEPELELEPTNKDTDVKLHRDTSEDKTATIGSDLSQDTANLSIQDKLVDDTTADDTTTASATDNTTTAGTTTDNTTTSNKVEEANTPDRADSSPTPPPPPPKDHVSLNQSKESTHEQDEKQDSDTVAISEPMKDADDVKEDDSRSEIQSIMDQFEDESAGAELEKIMSPRLEIAQPTFTHPPRTSSLDPVSSQKTSPGLHKTTSRDSYSFSPAAARPGSISGASVSSIQQTRESTVSPRPASAIFQPPPPSPDPEPALPFDFHRFLEQLRHRTADPVARFLRSFLSEFGKKQWMVHEQVKIISDFLEFIAKKMTLCDVWRTVSDVEFDNAREGMEKLVMNRLYNQTFSPAIPAMVLSPSKSKRGRSQASAAQPPGRKGQHQEDVERDAVIAQKIRIYGWIREEHLDIPTVSEKGRKFLLLAQQELLKINSYRAPRDKVICVLNACKVIFGFLKNSKGDQSADSFVPLLIYTVLHANPDHLVSNVQYILRFRNQEKLGGEAGYYISSLMGVVSFVENLDRTNLTVTDEEFERNVEAAVSAITEGHRAEQYESATHEKSTKSVVEPELPESPTKSSYQPHYSEKGAPSRPELTPRNSTEGERAGLYRKPSTRQKGSGSGGMGSSDDEKDAVTGLLRTIQKPLSTIGRIFSDEGQQQSSQHPASTPQPGSTPRLSPDPRSLLSQSRNNSESYERRVIRSPDRQQSKRATSVGRTRPDILHADEDAAARQSRAEAAEAQNIQAQEHRVVVETLQGMFPDLDREVISDVVRVKDGRVGLAVDACLALSN